MLGFMLYADVTQRSGGWLRSQTREGAPRRVISFRPDERKANIYMRFPVGRTTSSTLSVGDNLDVQQLGFGTWAWGNKLLWGYDEDSDRTLQQAFDSVCTPSGPFDQRQYFFDTGDSYGTGALEGRAESLLGSFRRASPRPESCVIGTKLAVYPNRITGESFENACRASLQRMGRDQIEIVQAHWSAQNFQPWQEPALWDGLARCYEAGLAQSVGTSNFGPKQCVRRQPTPTAHSWAARPAPRPCYAR